MSVRLSTKNRSSTVASNKYYSDLNLAFTWHPGLKDVRPLYDVAAVKNSVKNLVMTGSGDYPFHPEIGSGIFSYLFENGNAFTAAAIKSSIIQILDMYEPRVDQVSVDVVDELDLNSYHITINFRIKSPNINTEVSFYLERLR